MVMGTPQGFGVQMQQRAGQGGQQPGAGGIPQGFQGFHPGANFTGPQSMPHNARVAGGMGPPPPKPAQQQVGFNIPGAQQSTPPGRGKPPAASPSSFTPGSLSQTRGFRIHTVEEDGAESDDMDMDGVGGSDPNSRRSSGMGARKRSNEAFNDPSGGSQCGPLVEAHGIQTSPTSCCWTGKEAPSTPRRNRPPRLLGPRR